MSAEEKLKMLFQVSSQDFSNTQQFIIDKYARTLTPAKKPVVYILGAQPGAGKTELEKIARLEVGDNIVSCNADLFRDYHPDVEIIRSEYEPFFPEITAEIAQAWNNGLRKYCEDNRLNYILETTFSSGELMNQTIAGMKEKGYDVRIKLLAVHPTLSLLSTFARFEKMKANEGHGRLVGKQAHDQRFDKIVPTLLAVQTGGLYDSLEIYGRNIVVSHSNKIAGVRLIGENPVNPMQVFQEEINRKWPVKLQLFFEQLKNTVLQMMQERYAPENEIEVFLQNVQPDSYQQKQQSSGNPWDQNDDDPHQRKGPKR